MSLAVDDVKINIPPVGRNESYSLKDTLDVSNQRESENVLGARCEYTGGYPEYCIKQEVRSAFGSFNYKIHINSHIFIWRSVNHSDKLIP
jgi:hypothetical protein